MRGLYENYITDLNKEVSEYAMEKDLDRNYIHLFRPYEKKPLNIYGSFEDAIKKENEDAVRKEKEAVFKTEIANAIKHRKVKVPNFNSDSRNSFGMGAEESFEKYKELLLKKKSPYSSKEDFAKYVSDSKHYNAFCVDKEEYEYFIKYCRERVENRTDNSLRSLSEKETDALMTARDIPIETYRKAFFVICMMDCFWCYFFEVMTPREYSSEEEKALYDALKVHAESFCDADKMEPGKSIRVRGRLSQSLIDRYGNVSISIKGKKNPLLLKELYCPENREYFNHVGTALYSGVVPRVCRIHYTSSESENNDIHMIRMDLGRTSYMTMHAFGNKYAAKFGSCELIKDTGIQNQNQNQNQDLSVANIFEAYIQAEATIQEDYCHDMDNIKSCSGSYFGKERFKKELVALNRYLQSSWSIHNTNISGNLITTEEYCIYTKRAAAMQDPNRLFCSVNGGSEIYDSKVSFYSNSVNEDKPAILYSWEPVYFGGELTREAMAELGIFDNSSYWIYYGFTAMANKKGNGTKAPLWLHFNIIGERNCSNSFNQIEHRRLTASERFENSDMYGYLIQVYKNRGQRKHARLWHLVDFALEYPEVLQLLLIVVFFILKRINKSDVQGIPLWEVIMMVILCVSEAAVIARRKVNSIKKRRTITSIEVESDNYKLSKKKLNEALFKTSEYDPIFCLLSHMRLLSFLTLGEEENKQ